MRTIACTVFTLGLFGGSALALQPPDFAALVVTQEAQQSQISQAPGQTPAGSSPSPAYSATEVNTLRVAPGSVIPAQLNKTIDAKKTKQGDEVTAKVTQNLTSNTGEVIVPKDTEVSGHITQVQASTKEQKQSELGITFDKLQTKKGETATLPMSIQAIVAPRNPAADTAGTPAPAPGGEPSGMPSGANGSDGRYAPMEGQPPASQPSSTEGTGPGARPDSSPRGPITAKTQGVVGYSNLKLSAPADPAQGSLVSSEKGNVKIDGGSMLLLRVDPGSSQ